jgi:heavy metal sensor kinase
VNLRSIRVRLAAWNALGLMVTFALAGGGVWLTMRTSIHDSVDEDLRARLTVLRREVNTVTDEAGTDRVRDRLRNLQTMGPGARFRLSDGTRWIYQSPGAEKWGDETIGSPGSENSGVARTVFVGTHPVRVLTAPVTMSDAAWTVEIGLPMGEFYEALDDVAWTVVLVSPVVLILASVSGYWMSTRALAPVARITQTARAIGAEDLAERLPLRGADDELDRLSETLNDMFARLDASFRRITQFTADASHELRTPVAIIRTTAELARRRPRSDADYGEALDRILAESERTSRLIDDLLLLARIDAGGEEFGVEPVDLAETLRGACDDGRLLADAAGVSFVVDLGSPCVLLGDPRALRRLFLILMDNAAKYTPRGGTIRVTMHVESANAVIDVQDNGIGIGPEDLPHLFERFYRVGHDRSRVRGGVGLGLSIAQRIAAGHGGQIFVDSQPGIGSTFRVRLRTLDPTSA